MPTRIDLYTKFILTIIAGCLLTMSIRTLWEPPPVAAQPPLSALRVVIAGFDPGAMGRGLPVNIVGSGDQEAVPVMFMGGGRDGHTAVPVSVVNTMVPVSVNGVGQEGKAAVSVNVVQVNSREVGNAGIPVALPAGR